MTPRRSRACRALSALGAVLLACAGCAQDPSRTPPAAPPAGAVAAGTVLGSSVVTGLVTFAGKVPSMEPISMGSDRNCHRRSDGDPVREEYVVKAGGALKNVFVRVVSGLEGKVFAPPEAPVELDQRGCVYRPHVAGVQAGQPVVLINSDPTLHNVHIVAQHNKAFNVGMSIEGQRMTRYFHQPEIMIKAKCDVHPWMSAWIGVVEHPYFAVTGDDGGFSIPGLPPGTYALELWHEALGTRRVEVTLGDGETKRISETFPG